MSAEKCSRKATLDRHVNFPSADKDLNSVDELLRLSLADVEKLSSILDGWVGDKNEGFLDAVEHKYFGETIFLFEQTENSFAFGVRCGNIGTKWRPFFM